jgi:hypothetical protein
MRNIHTSHALGTTDLQAIAAGERPSLIDDMEFLETLARRRCLVMPPWVYHIEADGHLEKLTPVQYGEDYNLDKASMLLAVMRKLAPVH